MKFFALLCMAGMALASPLNKSNGGLIVGGELVQAGDCKFQISLQRSSHICGGAILDENTIITAAHCVSGTAASSLRIRAHTLQHNSGGQLIQVSKNTPHPQYDSWTINNDVAILKLATPIVMGPQAAPIPLVAGDYNVETSPTITVSGWGTTREGGSIPTDLLKVTVPVVDRVTCNQKYGSNQITDKMFCAGVLGVGGKDACQGDSGGPVWVNDGGVEKLVGVVSWGRGCARPDYPGVYTDLPSLMDWINANK